MSRSPTASRNGIDFCVSRALRTSGWWTMVTRGRCEHGILGFTLKLPDVDRVLHHIWWRDDPPPAQW